MANDTIPMSDMFRTCLQVLQQELRPLHYATLTELALNKLGLNKGQVHWARQIEDVREKLLMAGQYDTFYIGQPYCVGGLRWWFEDEQLRLFHPSQGIVIPGNASAGASGAFEALMRDPYLKIKTSARRIDVVRCRTNGFVLEHHVAKWFKAQWPMFYQEADNAGRWELHCDHDFKLCVDDRVFKVDVTGPKSNGIYGNPGGGKKITDIHLACEIIGKDVLWRSVLIRDEYKSIIDPNSDGVWPERLAVWLNCKKHNIDYRAIKITIQNNHRQN